MAIKKNIIRESDRPVVVKESNFSVASGNYNMIAVGPSNETIEWTFYSSIYTSGVYTNPITTNHGTASSNQFGKAKKSLSFVNASGEITSASGVVVQIWASGGGYETYIDTLEYIVVGWSGVAGALWGDTVSGVFI